MRVINEIIIHCSASNIDSYDFAAIKHDHIKNRGWSDIGYHYGVDWDGDIHILRPVDRPGAHARGHNSHSIGICILGLDNFTQVQFEQLARLVKDKMLIFDLSPDQVVGHYQYNKNKTCPNFDVEWFKEKYLGV